MRVRFEVRSEVADEEALYRLFDAVCAIAFINDGDQAEVRVLTPRSFSPTTHNEWLVTRHATRYEREPSQTLRKATT